MEENGKEQEKEKLGFILGHKRRLETPKVEAEPEYNYERAVPIGKYNSLVLLVLIFTVIIIVLVLVYAVYIFFHGSQLVEMADIHLGGNIKKAGYEILKFFKSQ